MFSKDINPLYLDIGEWRFGGPAPRPVRFTPKKEPVPMVQEAGWALGSIWTCAKNLAPPGFDPRTVQPEFNQSQYRLSYRAPSTCMCCNTFHFMDYIKQINSFCVNSFYFIFLISCSFSGWKNHPVLFLNPLIPNGHYNAVPYRT
jgi:hypothetical protein